jgi:uncharacterized protein (DUF58 family)
MLSRSLSAPVVTVDQSASVKLVVTNLGARTGLLLAEEQLPRALGERPRFTISGMRVGHTRRVEYPLRAAVRGSYEIGPIQIRIVDPFGMLALRQQFAVTSRLLVVPAIEDLPESPAAGARSRTGEARPQPFSVGDLTDGAVREYRLGDDIRRVHWASTARTGELMVRSEERPWQARCTLYVDNRIAAHRGTGRDSSFERAITVAASIAAHLGRFGFAVRLISAGGQSVESSWRDRPDQNGSAAEQLAVLPGSSVARVGIPVEPEGLLIAVFGAVADADRSDLIQARVRGQRAYAISLNVDTWAARVSTAESAPGADLLRGCGWTAVDLSRGGSLAEAWQELGR